MKMRARKSQQRPLWRRRLRFGVLAGKVTVPADFDAPLPRDVADSFEGDKDPYEKVLRRMADKSKAVEVNIDALADIGGLAPEIRLVPRRRPAS